MKMYMVGGACRDEILGVPSKDIDFTVVLDEQEVRYLEGSNLTPFQLMVTKLQEMGFKIFLQTPEYLTVRAQFPSGHPFSVRNDITSIKESGKRSVLTADFVLARKEEEYSDGRRPDKVTPGTLYDDLARRDFTVNAIAKDGDIYIDPFAGRADISMKVIRAVGDPLDRFTEDALRAVRALRFSVTKGFNIEASTKYAMQIQSVLDSIVSNISDERIQVELSKMFRFDTVASVIALNEFPALTRAMFAGSVSLDATLKTKGRGK